MPLTKKIARSKLLHAKIDAILKITIAGFKNNTIHLVWTVHHL